MSRLQKKCLIATTGCHLLLVLTLVFGSAFFATRTKPDDSQVLTVIPDKLIDEALNSGVKNAQPPAPNPNPPTPVPPQPVDPPTPKPPTPVDPPAPKPPVKPVDPEPVKQPKLPPIDLTPVEKPQPRKPKVDLTPVVRSTPKTPDTSAEDAAREAKRLNDQRKKAFANAISSINKNTSTSTVVDMPGASSAAYASYKDALASLYYDAWTPPTDVSNDDAVTKVRIIIARDGTIISAQIIGPSGDASVDASVRRALDRVTSVPPLPEGTKENQRTLILNFNLKTKRMIG